MAATKTLKNESVMSHLHKSISGAKLAESGDAADQWVAKFSKGDLSALSPKLRAYISDNAAICKPDSIFICDGSDEENTALFAKMEKDGMIKKLPKYDNCWLTRTDPADVARVEKLTFISTHEKKDTIPTPKEGVKGTLGFWMSEDEMHTALTERFPGCMKGRIMYVIPFSMGVVGSPLGKTGIQLTDSPYVVASMRIMTRMGSHVIKALGDHDFVKCLHSVGVPLPTTRKIVNSWPCNPEREIIAHLPERNEICSYGSGYGGNSLLGKKCLALRLGSFQGHHEGWLAEHMVIMGVTNPEGKKIYITAAFPSQCGKTNLAMLVPTLPGYKVETVGDDIAWLKFDKEGVLRGINPEAGLFGVCPGTSLDSNPSAMATITSNTIFTNVAETPDGGFWWEGLEKDIPVEGLELIDWTGKPWKIGSKTPAAQPNSRFCAPMAQCPVKDPQWENPEGVPISAIIFGGRRPEGVPLVYETFSWEHGVFTGSAMKSETTSAAEYSGKSVMHDPFGMRPFFGYNFGKYLEHWLSFGKNPVNKLPKIYHVNWFRKDSAGKFLWPGFGNNIRVLDWIVRRVAGEDCAVETAIGSVPAPGALNVEGLKDSLIMEELFSLPKEFWVKEVESIGKYYDEQLPEDLPQEMRKQLDDLKARVEKMK